MDISKYERLLRMGMMGKHEGLAQARDQWSKALLPPAVALFCKSRNARSGKGGRCVGISPGLA